MSGPINVDWRIIRTREGATLVDEGNYLRGASEVEADLLEQVEQLKAGLFQCAREAGADVSEGPPSWPSIVEWAVHAVIAAREVDEEGYAELTSALLRIREEPDHAEAIADHALKTGNPVGDLVSLSTVLEFLRTGTQEDPRTGRNRAMTGWKGAADALERKFGP